MNLALRLTYFDGAGRAELIRLVLAVGKMDYEDRRIGSEQWTRLKPSECQEQTETETPKEKSNTMNRSRST